MSWNPNENPNTLLITVLYDKAGYGWEKVKVAVGSNVHKAIQGDPEHADLLTWYKAV